MTRVHTFMEACWRIQEVDAASDRETRDQLLIQIYEQAGSALGEVTRATREVLLDGPTAVSRCAERVHTLGLRSQRMIKAMIGDDAPEQRSEYDAAYEEFRETYLNLIELARNALEVKEGRS